MNGDAYFYGKDLVVKKYKSKKNKKQKKDVENNAFFTSLFIYFTQ